jgi:hypothetical protein
MHIECEHKKKNSNFSETKVKNFLRGNGTLSSAFLNLYECIHLKA